MIYFKKKGVSPVVATTTLIGLTVAITAIVLLFGGEISEELQQKQGINIEKQLQCDAISFKATDISQGNRIQVSNDGEEDIYAFLLRLKGEDGEGIDAHHKVYVPQGGIGEIIAAGSAGLGCLDSVKIFANSVAGPNGNVIWGTCPQTETTVKLNNC